MGGPKVYSVRAVMATSGLSFTESCAVVLQKAANPLQFTLVRARKDNWQSTAHFEQIVSMEELTAHYHKVQKPDS